MNTYVTGSTIRQLRESRHLTQAELAEKIGVSSKTVSKWETAKGLPDISLLQPLAQALGISVIELMNGERILNKNVSANMLRCKFYVCPVCGNVIISVGEGVFSCCGITLPVCEIEERDADHAVKVEIIDGDYVVTFDHPMSKEHYISFICYVTGSTSELVKQYPEQDAIARFRKKGHGIIYACCNRHGLYRVIV